MEVNIQVQCAAKTLNVCHSTRLHAKIHAPIDHTLQTPFLHAKGEISPDVKAALEIQDSDVRPIDIAMSALTGDFCWYEFDRLGMVSLPKFGSTVCRYSSC